MQPSHVVDHFTAIGAATGLALVVHIYPAWTKATYSSDLLAELARLPWVTTFKIGTREMSKYDRDIRAIRAANPECTILTCHDEYLLPTMVQGVDGALVGFGSFIPEWIAGLYGAVSRGDLRAAQEIQAKIYRLKEVVYASDEPSGEAHARLKAAMMLAGRFPSRHMLPPVQAPEGAVLERIRVAVEGADLAPIPDFSAAVA
jgi:4-hydroxy-tetrahydrodipicolinate synthase